MDSFGYYPHYCSHPDSPSSPPPASGDGFSPVRVCYPTFIDTLKGREKDEAMDFMNTLVVKHSRACAERHRLGLKRKVLGKRIRLLEKKIRRMECNPELWEKNGIDSVVPIPDVLRSYLHTLKEQSVLGPKGNSTEDRGKRPISGATDELAEDDYVAMTVTVPELKL